ncbi:MAG TPA: ABC transporter permease [Polyangiaceae bacterium]|nr:ABC transporter permease [Polyangiaceae bacterium]
MTVFGLTALAPPGSSAQAATWSAKAAKAWFALGFGAKVGVIALLVFLLLWAIVKGLGRLGRSGRRSLLVGGTALCVLATIVLGVIVARLPEPVGTYFVLWHQLVRVGAAASATLAVLGSLALGLPWMLDRLEARGALGFVAARHVRATKSGFLTIISVLSIAGVAVSCLALVVVISVMGGFGADLKRKILGNNAHISLDRDNVGGFGDWDRALDEARRVPGVKAASPMVSGEAMASSTSNTAGVILRGIDPDTVGQVMDLIKNVEVGDFEFLRHPEGLLNLPPDMVIGLGPGGFAYRKGPSYSEHADLIPSAKPSSSDLPATSAVPSGSPSALSAGGEPAAAVAPKPGPAIPSPPLDDDVKDILRPKDAFPGLIVGRELAKSLHVLVGDEVSLVAPLGDLGPMGVMPRTRRFRIAGIFYSGMYEYDASHVYVTLETAQEFLDLAGRITSIESTVVDAENVRPVAARMVDVFQARGLRVRDWQELNKSLFSALKLEKIATFIILVLAIIVACFCIICTLLLMVTEKSKEIAIIKALGASDRMVLGIFMLEGSVIGAMGTSFGVITGWVMCEGLKRFGVRLDPEVYYVDRLPIEVNPSDYALIAFFGLAITVAATLYPAYSASRLRPVDGIRYE